jgi:hypothetical protein
VAKWRGAKFSVLASKWKISMMVQSLVGIDVLRVLGPGKTLIVLVLKLARELIAQKVQSGKNGRRFEAKFVKRMKRLVDVKCFFVVVEDFTDEVIAGFSECKKLEVKFG